MDKEDLAKIVAILEQHYPLTINDDMQQNLLASFQNESGRVVKRAVRKWALREEEFPSFRNLQDEIERVKREESNPYFDIHSERLVKCLRCKDKGYILYEKNGNDYMRPCDCEVGKRRYPWG